MQNKGVIMKFICLRCKGESERKDYNDIVQAKGLCIICETLGDKAYSEENAIKEYQPVEQMRRVKQKKKNKSKKIIKVKKTRYSCDECAWTSGYKNKQPVMCPACKGTKFTNY